MSFLDPVKASDGFTYERNAIERWFQIRKSSPCTGLELEDTDLKSNGQLANEIKNWINGEDIQQPPVRSSKRLRFSLSGDKKIDIQFFSRMGSFGRRIPTSLAVNDLYSMAFRGLKGRHTRFGLHSNNVVIKPSQKKISSLNIVDGSIIHINIDSSTLTDSQKKTDATSDTAFEELCLIKVYKQPDDILFSYWTPKTTTNTLTSILFRYWRHESKKGWGFWPQDVDVWCDLDYRGDGYFVGVPHSPLDDLSALLTPKHATGTLEKEQVYMNKVADASDSSDDSTDGDGPSSSQKHTEQPLVLKVFLTEHRSANSWKKSMRQKSLTRVNSEPISETSLS